MSYTAFLESKQLRAERAGVDVDQSEVNGMLHPWQREIVSWAAGIGRAAIWADTGLGKTFMQVEWARLSGATSLIIAPLAVTQQTIREAAKLGVTATYVRDGASIAGPGVYITNYEMAERFHPEILDAVVLDEASILKQSDGKTRTMLIKHFASVPRRLACTATPAPNDPEELTNQAEFLGQMSRVNMLAAYFVHDDRGWRLKGHARAPMMRWMSGWALAIRRPSDMGYPDDGYILPGLEIIPEIVSAEIEAPEGQLFAADLGGVGRRAAVRRETLKSRVERVAELVYDCAASGRSGVHEGVLPGEQREVEANPGTDRSEERPTSGALRQRSGVPRESDRAVGTSESQKPRDGHGPRCSLSEVQPGVGSPERRPDPSDGDVRLPHACVDQWVIWCGLNDEQDAVVKALGSDCGSIDGRTKIEDRVRLNEAWIRGEFRFLIVKPGMYSFGMNWQHCARMAFVGLSDSYESYYQAIRRCYRYGQRRIVRAHVVLSELESQIAANVRRKETEAALITGELVAAMREARS